MKTIAELTEAFAHNEDISDFSTGMEEIIQSRVNALAEATKQEALSDIGFVQIKEEEDKDKKNDETKDGDDAKDDDKEAKSDKEKTDEELKEQFAKGFEE